MDFASSTREAENRTRWKGIVVKSSVVPQQPCRVMGENRIEFQLIQSKFLSYRKNSKNWDT